MTPSRTTAGPVRIQRKRSKGWKMPPNTASVDRSTIWGNPFLPGRRSGVFNDGKPDLIGALTLEQCVAFYRDLTGGFLSPEMYPWGHDHQKRFAARFTKMSMAEAARAYLRGKNLACWCPLDQPCHADVLLELANK